MRIDAQDDPGAPACLPKSGIAGHWVKHEPVILFDDETELIQSLPPDEVPRFAPFHIRSAARCAYASGEADPPLIAHVLLVEADSVADAYGLMSSHPGRIRAQQLGGEAREERRDGLRVHCWQASYYVRAICEDSSKVSARQLDTLLRHIVSRIPRAEPPEILSALPTEDRRPGGQWLVRSLWSVRPVDLGLTDGPDLGRVEELLGLGEHTLMCIGAYDVAGAKRPNLVWLVQYPTTDAAQDAYYRYITFLDRAGHEWESSNVMEPHGAYLVGTWTAEEESLAFVTPRIADRLPAQPEGPRLVGDPRE